MVGVPIEARISSLGYVMPRVEDDGYSSKTIASPYEWCARLRPGLEVHVGRLNERPEYIGDLNWYTEVMIHACSRNEQLETLH